VVKQSARKRLRLAVLLKYLERRERVCIGSCRERHRELTSEASGERGFDPSPGDACGINPADHHEPADAEVDLISVFEGLYAQLSELDRKIVDLRLQDRTLERIAAAVGRWQSTVSNRLQRIRGLLQSP